MSKRHKMDRKNYEEFAEQFPAGRENALSMQAMCKFFGVTDRDLRNMVKQARLHGCIIAGDDYGYYRPISLEELHAYRVIVHARYKTTGATLRAVDTAIRNYVEQEDC